MTVYVVRDEDKLIIGIFATPERATLECEKAKTYCHPYIIEMTVQE